ncbi:uncharacterized protein ACIBXB_016808 [Morphnus guianensis]
MSQQCALAAKKPNSTLGCKRRSAAGQVKGGDPSPLLSTGMLCPVLAFPGQEKDGHTGEGSTKGHQDDEGIGASLTQGEAVRVGTVQAGEVSGDLIHVYKYLMGSNEVVPSDRTRGNACNLKHLNTRNHSFYCQSGQTLELVAQRCCVVSICGDTQNPAGHCPGQPALADPARARGLDGMICRGICQPQPFSWDLLVSVSPEATESHLLCLPAEAWANQGFRGKHSAIPRHYMRQRKIKEGSSPLFSASSWLRRDSESVGWRLSESGWMRDRREGKELYVKDSECMPVLSPPRC